MASHVIKRMIKCSICPVGNNEFNGVDQLGQHIAAQHVKNASDVVHYLAKLEERLDTLEDKTRDIRG